MYVAAIVPTIDEAETIGDLVRSLDKMCDEVIVVDGSQGEDTDNAAREAGAEVVREGRGLGPSYAAPHFLIDKSWYVAHVDAGGSHDPADLYQMLELAEEGFDVVIGSRFCPRGEHHGAWRRRVTSRWASSALNLISFADIADWTSGYRVYSPKAREVLARHDFTTTGHAWQIESLWVLIHAGLRIVEHPIVYEASVSHLSSKRVKEAASLYWRLAKS